MSNSTLHIGIIGAGGFAAFAANAFAFVEGVKIIAVADLNKSAAEQLAATLHAKACSDYDDLLHVEKIDLIYIATPPFLHYEQSHKALLAGKHVICEKPAALRAAEAEALQSLAKANHLLYVVNLMQRYNPLYQAVKEIINRKLLGNFLHGYFENYASDENLGPEHWFWDETKSGGIFIEHGVHFFDMFSGWLGEGKLLNAVQLQRPGVATKLVDRVQATVLYGNAIVTFYHGFDQPEVLDRQELRLQFEKGDITLHEWVPVQMRLQGVLEHKAIEELEQLIGKSVEKKFDVKETKEAKGRFKSIQYDAHVMIESGSRTDKERRYTELVTAMLQDQWDWIKNQEHKRVIDGRNAVESVRMAEEATQIAQYITLQNEVLT